MIVCTERAIKTKAILDALTSVGYVSIGRPIMPKPRLLGILTILCNTIAEMMSVHPYRVYQAVSVRLASATRGAEHDAHQSKYVRAGEHQDADDLHVLCPCCGHDLLTAGPPTFDEIAAGMKANASQKSPHSASSEVENLPCRGKSRARKGKVRGTRGTGGGDPTGGGETVR